jgi:hypothetical protein
MNIHMDRTNTTDESRVDLGVSAGERELAGYLDALISAMLAEKALENSPEGGGADEPTAADAVAQEPDQPAARPSAPGVETPRLEAPPHAVQARNSSRASMREELLALFASPDRLSPPPAVAPYLSAAAESGELEFRTTEPSAFMQRFLPQTPQAPERASSGLAGVDARLDGGFGVGLHLVTGRPGIGKTAFLETVSWEAVSSRRPVLYYALKEGRLGAWTRLVSTLASILGSPAITLDALRGRALNSNEHAALTSLDQALQIAVLPWLSLIETVPTGADRFTTFIEDVKLRAGEAEKQHGRIPLLLIDDLDRLSVLTEARPLTTLLRRLDEALAANSLAGLVSMTTPHRSAPRIDGLPGRTILALMPVSAFSHEAIDYVDLKILTDARRGWTGTVPLLLDRRSGVFAPRD